MQPSRSALTVLAVPGAMGRVFRCGNRDSLTVALQAVGLPVFDPVTQWRGCLMLEETKEVLIFEVQPPRVRLCGPSR